MTINFPDNPVLNQTYSYGSIVWRYDGEKWRVTGTASQPTVQVSSGMPAGASDGDAWVDSDDGALYVYYDNFWIAPTVNYALPTSAVNTNQIANGAVTSEKALTSAASTITGTNAEGTSTSFARADHNHQIQAVGAFSAYFSGSRTLVSTGAYLDFDAEDYDVSNWHDSTGTKGQYTPQKAGYYRLGVYWDAQALTSNSFYDVILRKNTVDAGRFLIMEQAGHPSYPFGRADMVVYANGTTDSFRIFAYHTSTSNRTLTTGSGVYACRFYGHFLGSA